MLKDVSLVSKIALAIPVLGLIQGVILLFIAPRNWEGWSWNPGFLRGGAVFLWSIAICVIILATAAIFRCVMKLWVRNTLRSRLLVYFICGLFCALGILVFFHIIAI